MRRAAAIALLALLAASAGGCETFEPLTCDRTPENNPEVTFTGGTTAGGVYESAQPMDSGPPELLQFDGGARFALQHGLGAKPGWVELWLSFDPHGTSDDGGMIAQAAGNQAVLTGFDETTIHVANDSCAQYYLLVRAGTGARP